jgi:hypothetical protein
MLTQIDVTQEDIDNGIERSCGFCPVALAVRRATDKNASVDEEDMQVWEFVDGLRRYEVATTPTEVTIFIKRFDRGMDVQPLSFTVEFQEDKYWNGL